MKKLMPKFLVIAFCIVALGVILATHHLAAHYLGARSTSRTTVECAQTRTRHTVIIQNGTVSPQNIQATTCDTLTITNADTQTREIAFGRHELHVPYNGITEKTLMKGDSLTVTLNQTGTYIFHDHLEDAVKGDFTVSP